MATAADVLREYLKRQKGATSARKYGPALGMTRGNMQMLLKPPEKGGTRVSADVLDAIAHARGVDLSRIFREILEVAIDLEMEEMRQRKDVAVPVPAGMARPGVAAALSEQRGAQRRKKPTSRARVPSLPQDTPDESE